MLQFPNIDPIAFQIGPIAVRWYGLMYLLGFVCGYFLVRWLAPKRGVHLSKDALLGLINYLAIGVIVGGRLGYVLFWNLSYFLSHPLEIFAFWQGGMAFHGGIIGALVMGWWYLRKEKLPFYPVADLISVATPIGLGFGRIGNFINGELYGRPTDMPWGMVFPYGGPVPRHPSQLYEAFLEGPVLFAILLWLALRVRSDGVITWAFIGGYGVFRFCADFFREPDPVTGLVMGLTRGQYYSLIMIVAAAVFFLFRKKGAKPQGKKGAKPHFFPKNGA
jgi:phosphatidylglycerol:prolipoprotein diacylglycerol transferase